MTKTFLPTAIFLKWAGGKRQILPQIRHFYPKNITHYVEPFVGGGAVLFDILERAKPKNSYISDVNRELVLTYLAVRDSLHELVLGLESLRAGYRNTKDQKEFYQIKRERFNRLKQEKSNDIELSALLIFLNKTCFNGLYRVNKSGDFNVSMGRYKNPRILDIEGLARASELLQGVEIAHASYENSLNFAKSGAFFYLDPPYRPLGKSSSFTAYSSEGFDDVAQNELAEFVKKIDTFGARFLLSNSDPKNSNPNDDFFDELYAPFLISRILVKRAISSDSAKRSAVSEILVSNF